MGFKKINYGQEGRFKIKIEDADGTNIGNWTIMMSDLWKWADMMARKYGIKRFQDTKDRDLDWAR